MSEKTKHTHVLMMTRKKDHFVVESGEAHKHLSRSKPVARLTLSNASPGESTVSGPPFNNGNHVLVGETVMRIDLIEPLGKEDRKTRGVTKTLNQSLREQIKFRAHRLESARSAFRDNPSHDSGVQLLKAMAECNHLHCKIEYRNNTVQNQQLSSVSASIRSTTGCDVRLFAGDEHCTPRAYFIFKIT